MSTDAERVTSAKCLCCGQEMRPTDYAARLRSQLTAEQEKVKRLREIIARYLKSAENPMGMAGLADIDADARATLEATR